MKGFQRLLTIGVISCLVSLRSTPAFASTFEKTISASPPWTDTDLSLDSGDTFSITASGLWRHDHCCGSLYGPDGSPSENDLPGFNLSFTHAANKGSLIGLIVPTGQSADYPYALPLNDTKFFNVGSNLPSFEADYPGKLFLGFNDTIFNDNQGFVTATITSPAVGGPEPPLHSVEIGSLSLGDAIPFASGGPVGAFIASELNDSGLSSSS